MSPRPILVSLGSLCAGFGIAIASHVVGAEERKTTKPSPIAAPAAAPTPVESPEDRAIKDWMAKLNGSTWSLELKPSGGSTAQPQQDTLSFQGRRVTSAQLSKVGYRDSNYTLRVEDDGTAVWETMQMKDGEGSASWRGEIHGDKMSGALTRQPLQGDALTWYFTASKLGASAPAPEAPPTAPSPAPAVQPTPIPSASPPASTPAPTSGAPKEQQKKTRGFW